MKIISILQNGVTAEHNMKRIFGTSDGYEFRLFKAAKEKMLSHCGQVVSSKLNRTLDEPS